MGSAGTHTAAWKKRQTVDTRTHTHTHAPREAQRKKSSAPFMPNLRYPTQPNYSLAFLLNKESNSMAEDDRQSASHPSKRQRVSKAWYVSSVYKWSVDNVD